MPQGTKYQIGDEGAIAVIGVTEKIEGFELVLWNHRLTSAMQGLVPDVHVLYGQLLQTDLETDILALNMQDEQICQNEILEIDSNN